VIAHIVLDRQYHRDIVGVPALRVAHALEWRDVANGDAFGGMARIDTQTDVTDQIWGLEHRREVCD
jgi:hypothetical protein